MYMCTCAVDGQRDMHSHKYTSRRMIIRTIEAHVVASPTLDDVNCSCNVLGWGASLLFEKKCTHVVKWEWVPWGQDWFWNTSTLRPKPVYTYKGSIHKANTTFLYGNLIFSQVICVICSLQIKSIKSLWSITEGNMNYLHILYRKLEVVGRNVKNLHYINTAVAVVAVVGKFHSGKSFLLNQLMGKQEGFGVGPSVRPQTMGIWMWGKVGYWC